MLCWVACGGTYCTSFAILSAKGVSALAMTMAIAMAGDDKPLPESKRRTHVLYHPDLCFALASAVTYLCD